MQVDKNDAEIMLVKSYAVENWVEKIVIVKFTNGSCIGLPNIKPTEYNLKTVKLSSLHTYTLEHYTRYKSTPKNLKEV